MFKITSKLVLLLMAGGFCFLLTGCSSEVSQPEEVSVSEKKADKPRKQVKSAAAPVPKSKKKEEPPKKEQPEIIKDAKPEDFFAVTAPVPNFQILDTNLQERNTFRVTPPGDDFGSSSYRIVKAGGQRTRPPHSKKELPEGFSAISEFGYAEDGMPLRILCEADDSEMAYIPGGVAVIGSELGPEETKPVLAVELDPFYMDVNEVTVEQFKKFLDDNPATGSIKNIKPLNLDASSDYPILGIKWHEARKYANWTGKQLPTEAQWERVARSPEGYQHVWGNGRPTWSRARTVEQIDPVQSYPSDMTEDGVYDMAGNAMEWCRDDYSPNSFKEASEKAAGTVLKEWTGPKSSEIKGTYLIKGNGPNWEAWHRAGQTRAERSPRVGFRCVLELNQNKETPEK